MATPTPVLAGFFVRGLFAAPLAEFLQLKAIPRVGFALRGDVVPPLAGLARKRDGRSLVAGHVALSSFRSESC